MSSPPAQGRPPGSATTHVLRFVVVGVVLAWSALVAVVIAREPERGAASPAELARACEVALNDGDAESLARLFGRPLSEDGAAVAESVVARAGSPRGRWTVEPDPGANGAVLVIADATGLRARWRAEEDDGRWLVDPIASPSAG
ncbi:hypothetical protein [Saccharothrix xinjiangensis]|uniref:Uncharacterized protein n=1 Tax=Saccharothrix xinjiangensis TaxID=204798 RepID=A0ABV9YFI8_9PSEU